MAFDPITIDADADTITADILTGLATRIPGWLPNEGAPEVALAEEFALQIAATNALALASTQLAAAGVATAFGFAPIEAAKATLPGVQLTLSLPASAGTAPFTQAMAVLRGFTIAVSDVAFTLANDATALVNFTAATDGSWHGTMSVDLIAVDAGAAGNVNAGATATVISATLTVIAATVINAGIGGTDAESIAAFLARFTAWAATLRPGGVLASDVAALATTITGVQRALALDMYNPAAPTVPAEKTITVIAVDAAGAVLTGGKKAELTTLLESTREVNFIFHLIDPTYTNVALNVTIARDSAYTTTAVHDAALAALTALISPANWGTVSGDITTWSERDSLSSFDVSAVLGRVAGVASITAISINGSSTAASLTGPGALPSPLGASGSTITVTVV
jgi:hypothetical protein